MRFEVGAFALMATVVAGCSVLQPVEKAGAPGHPSPTIAQIRARGEFIVGLSGDQPPLNSTEKTGEIVGFEPDIAKLLADSLGFKLRLVTKPFNELLPALQAGELDAVISGVTMTPERNLDVAFVGPYFVSGKSVLAKAKTIKSIDDTADLDNPKMRLVVLAGSTSEIFVKELLPKAQMIPIASYEDGVQMILKDQADALVADFPYCVLQVLQHPEAKLVTLGEPFTYEPLGIALRGDDPLFTNLVTNFLITMEGTGRLFDMKVRWFSDGPWLDEMEPERKPHKRKPGEQSASLESESMADFEKLGLFYLGRSYDVDAKKLASEPLLYDSKDLTTHAVCIGMTGSGKTGLCVALLEEAAIDGVPAIAIDPKGDLGNLLLTFPNLDAASFRPWIDASEAARKGHSVDDEAAAVAASWKSGLADWGQDGARVGRYRDAVEAAIYTPGSRAGRPLAVLGSLAAPPAALREDTEALSDKVEATTAGLLALVGIDADPLKSREQALVANLLSHAWSAGHDLALPDLIRGVQDPPFDRVGVFALESFYPAKERMALALALNNLLASPGFAVWTEGAPLDVGRLLYTDSGKPRLAVISIAHLSEPERMFFVALLLNEVLSWARTQPGSQSLRAILYMDEVFGYLPPTANPPSKKPLLTLLKQARAYGLGVVLATQNPVDLDYKALANIGTWLLGRLQTERDKLRVLDGLEGLAAGSLDRAAIDRILSSLGKRTFLMHDVHEDGPVVFQTRWALSYLAGPLTREQIAKLSGTTPRASDAAASQQSAPSATRTAPSTAPAGVAAATGSATSVRPVLEPGVTEVFLRVSGEAQSGSQLLYRPRLLARAKLHYVHTAANLDTWQTLSVLGELEPGDAAWANAAATSSVATEATPQRDAAFDALPDAGAHAGSYKAWSRALEAWLYRERPLELRQAAALKAWSRPNEAEGEFIGRLSALRREDRDREVEKTKSRYASKIAALNDRIRRNEQRVDREREQYQAARSQAAISFGATVLGSLFGRKLGSSSTIGRATTTMRGAGRAVQQKADVDRAEDDVETLRKELADLEQEVDAELARIAAAYDAPPADIATVAVAPRKADITVEQVVLAWEPLRSPTQ